MTATITLKRVLSVLVLLGAFALVGTAHAQVTINFAYDGTNTVATYTVATNTFSSALFYGGTGSYAEQDLSSGGFIQLTGATYDIYGNGSTPFTNTSWGSTLAAASYTGGPFELQAGGYVDVPHGYNLTTGSALTGTMTWTNTDLVALGFTSNLAANGSFSAMGATVNWSTTNTSAVPEPASYAALLGLSALGFVVYKRRRKV